MASAAKPPALSWADKAAGRTSTSTAASDPSSSKSPTAIKSPKSEHDILLHLVSHIVGEVVRIQKHDRTWYEGVLESVNDDGGKLIAYSLAQAQQVTPEEHDNGTRNTSPYSESMIINGADVAMVVAKNTAVGNIRDPRETIGFKTDTQISNREFKERRLEKWTPDEPLPQDIMSLDEESRTFGKAGMKSKRGGKGPKWDQFHANRTMFGLETSFDEDDYNGKLDRNSAFYQSNLQRATQLAREIQNQQSENPHLAEERIGLTDVPAPHMLTEEELFSTVLNISPAPTPSPPPPKSEPQTSKYVIPSRRGDMPPRASPNLLNKPTTPSPVSAPANLQPGADRRLDSPSFGPTSQLAKLTSLKDRASHGAGAAKRDVVDGSLDLQSANTPSARSASPRLAAQQDSSSQCCSPSSAQSGSSASSPQCSECSSSFESCSCSSRRSSESIQIKDGKPAPSPLSVPERVAPPKQSPKQSPKKSPKKSPKSSPRKSPVNIISPNASAELQTSGHITPPPPPVSVSPSKAKARSPSPSPKAASPKRSPKAEKQAAPSSPKQQPSAKPTETETVESAPTPASPAKKPASPTKKPASPAKKPASPTKKEESASKASPSKKDDKDKEAKKPTFKFTFNVNAKEFKPTAFTAPQPPAPPALSSSPPPSINPSPPLASAPSPTLNPYNFPVPPMMYPQVQYPLPVTPAQYYDAMYASGAPYRPAPGMVPMPSCMPPMPYQESRAYMAPPQQPPLPAPSQPAPAPYQQFPVPPPPGGMYSGGVFYPAPRPPTVYQTTGSSPPLPPKAYFTIPAHVAMSAMPPSGPPQPHHPAQRHQIPHGPQQQARHGPPHPHPHPPYPHPQGGFNKPKGMQD